jgi:NADH dehydrogenase
MSHRIVIVGGGAGGLELATRLGRRLGKRGAAEIVLVDAHLTHTWKPLLHEVAVGSLDVSGNEVNYLAQAKWNHFQFQLGSMNAVDRASRTIWLSATVDENGDELVPGRGLTYDTLVIAVGSVTNDFNTPGAAEHCIFLDTPKQATRFHRQLLSRYLTAHALPHGAEKLEIAIIGAGATGVELAAELRHAGEQLAVYGLGNIRPEDLQITVVEAGPRVLPALPERLSVDVHRTLIDLGVKVLTNSTVTEITAEHLKLSDGKRIPATLKVWAAGIRAPGFLKNLDGLETNRLDQLLVRPTLQTTLDDNIFALGDCAACPMGDGSNRAVPPRAQAAHQQAVLLKGSLERRLKKKELPDYRYRDYGSLVSLSRFGAVGNLMGNAMRSVRVEGWLARRFYVSLYRMHQVTLVGGFRTALLMLSGQISRKTRPRLKLH